MELRCPECAGPEVERDRGEGAGQPLFAFGAERAASELRDPDGAIRPVSPHSDADELNALIERAQAAKLIEGERPHARLFVYPLSISEPDPLLAVDPGAGPTLLGGEPALRQGEGEDPVSFTVRFLEEAVEEANGLAAEAGGDSARLDRIATYMNEHRPWNGADVCEEVARELSESGRRLLEADE